MIGLFQSPKSDRVLVGSAEKASIDSEIEEKPAIRARLITIKAGTQLISFILSGTAV